MLAFRHRLLREPLGLDFTAAELEAEERQIHLGLYRNRALAGTVLLVRPDAHGTGKLRQMAVEPGRRDAGLARGWSAVAKRCCAVSARRRLLCRRG